MSLYKKYMEEIQTRKTELGFTGIGVAKSFVHVDTRDDTPVMWTY